MKNKERVIAIGWLAICFIGLITYIGLAKNYLDSDIASELIVAKLCAEENVIMTKSWYYATEIRLLNMNLPMTLFFHFISDYTFVRILSSMVMHALVLHSFFYCCGKAGLKRSGYLFASLLILPFSSVLFEYELTGLFYCVYIIVVFYSIGWVIALNDSNTDKKKKTLIWILYLVVAALIGATTIRELLVLYYPLVIGCFIMWLMDYLETYGERVITWTEIKSDIISGYRNNKYLCILLTSGIGAVVASLGYVVNVVVLRNIYFFSSFDRTIFTNVDDFARFSEVILGHARVLGYEPGCQFISVQGICNIGVLIFTVLLIWITYKMVKDNSAYSLPKRIIILYFACAVLFNDFIFIFSDKCGDRYMIPYIYTFVLILCIFVERKDIHVSVRKLFFVIVMGLFIINSAGKYVMAIVNEQDTSRQEAVEFIMDNDYHFGYATFWNGNVLTELTNGKVEVLNINIMSWENLGTEKWMMRKEILDYKTQDKLFVLLDQQQYEDNKHLTMFSDKYKVYDNKGYIIFEFKNSDELLSLQNKKAEGCK